MIENLYGNSFPFTDQCGWCWEGNWCKNTCRHHNISHNKDWRFRSDQMTKSMTISDHICTCCSRCMKELTTTKKEAWQLKQMDQFKPCKIECFERVVTPVPDLHYMESQSSALPQHQTCWICINCSDFLRMKFQHETECSWIGEVFPRGTGGWEKMAKLCRSYAVLWLIAPLEPAKTTAHIKHYPPWPTLTHGK